MQRLRLLPLRAFSTEASVAKAASSEGSLRPQPVQLKFSVARTVANQLPVYTDYRNGGTRRLTLVRKVTGDYQSLKEELQKVVGQEYPIEIHPGSVWIKGSHHTKKVKEFLQRLGF